MTKWAIVEGKHFEGTGDNYRQGECAFCGAFEDPRAWHVMDTTIDPNQDDALFLCKSTREDAEITVRYLEECDLAVDFLKKRMLEAVQEATGKFPSLPEEEVWSSLGDAYEAINNEDEDEEDP